MVAEISPDRIRLEKNGEETIIVNSDIKEIVVYKSASMDKGGIPMTPIEAYFFARVYCNNDTKYELNCLMDAKIDKSIRALHGVKIFRENGLFNLSQCQLGVVCTLSLPKPLTIARGKDNIINSFRSSTRYR